jgi:HlyD family secretion protein
VGLESRLVTGAGYNEKATAMKRHRLLLLSLLLVSAAALLYTYLQSRLRHTANVIHVSGNIEITDAEVSFKIAGRVEKRLVSEGETVAQGAVVAILDSTDLANEVAMRKAELWEAYANLAEFEAGYRPEEIEEAQAAVQQAEAYLQQLLTGSRPQEIEAAKATVARAMADVVQLERQFHRTEELHRKGLISTQEFDAARATYEAAVARLHEAEEQRKLVQEGPRQEQITQARAAVAQTRARYKRMLEGPRQEEIERARARVEKARGAKALADTRLGYATLLAPLSGVVLSENVEPGEYVAAGTPVVTIGDLEHVWLRAYINEADLGRVKVGQRVRVSTDTYPGKVYEGRLSFIASQAEFTPKNVQTAQERVKLVYRIKVDIANPNMELKPGMPADAAIALAQP